MSLMKPWVASWWERRISVILSRIFERQERREMGRKSEREEADGDLGKGIMTALFHWGGKKEQWRVLEKMKKRHCDGTVRQ